jgi:hypothetical protein
LAARCARFAKQTFWTSGLSILDLWIEALQSYPCIGYFHLPVDTSLQRIDVFGPSPNLLLKLLEFFNSTTLEALPS